MKTLLPGDAVLQTEEAWALRINARWRKSIESYFETGDLLIDAKNTLPHGEFESMIATRLLFHPSTARRLMIIARDQRLRAHVHDLPSSWGTIYELTKLSDDEFSSAIAQQVIRPDMLRGEAELIRPLTHKSSDGPREREGTPAALEAATHRIRRTYIGPLACGESPASLLPSETHMPSGGLAIAHNRVEPGNSLDFFPTPPWATRALFEHVFVHLGRKGHCQYQRAWEPACGKGHMAEPLTEYFREVHATDIADYGYGIYGVDFLDEHPEMGFDWIITNPPFNTSADFVLKALDRAGTGVAMFVRLAWLESADRYERIFRDHPPTCVAIFAERVPLHKGRWESEGSTMTAYIWLVWLKGAAPRAPFWIPPGCRERLTKADDVKRFGMSVEGEAA